MLDYLTPSMPIMGSVADSSTRGRERDTTDRTRPSIFEAPMPSSRVLGEYKAGTLHSGSKHGPIVTNKKQAVAIMLSERRDEQGEESARKRLRVTRKSR